MRTFVWKQQEEEKVSPREVEEEEEKEEEASSLHLSMIHHYCRFQFSVRRSCTPPSPCLTHKHTWLLTVFRSIWHLQGQQSSILGLRPLWACSVHPAPSSSFLFLPPFFQDKKPLPLSSWEFYIFCAWVFAPSEFLQRPHKEQLCRTVALLRFWASPSVPPIGGQNAKGPIILLDLPCLWLLPPRGLEPGLDWAGTESCHCHTVRTVQRFIRSRQHFFIKKIKKEKKERAQRTKGFSLLLAGFGRSGIILDDCSMEST